jgi:NADPH:quinone reductase-like Zn-dependent oxidoreductase
MQNKKIIIEKFGPAKDLVIKSHEDTRVVGADEVRVETAYSGINFADIVMRQGLYQDAPPKPFVPGYEISGVVTEIGKNVTTLTVGQHVLAGTRFGGYASQHVLPAWQVLALPEGLSLAEAAAIPVTFITSYLALHEFARIRKGDKILLETATGGVGVMAMQMAKEVGCEVWGLTTSAHKKEFIESYGAKALLKSEFENNDQYRDFDFILNSSGGKSLSIQYDRLNKAGKLTCIGVQGAISGGKRNIFSLLKTVVQSPRFPILKLTMESKMVSGFNALKFFDDDPWMQRILPKLNDPGVKPFIGKIFRAEDVAHAHDFLESRKAKGKVLLSWKD